MNDGRAVSTCSLGPLISAEIAAADSLQENGLVKYKGNAELSGLFRPALGTVVTFTYTMDGVTYTVPKRMRVLSSFANPLTRTTSVELGCLLTYKSDLREPEKIDTELANADMVLRPASIAWARNAALEDAYPFSWGATSPNSSGGIGLGEDYWQSDYKKIGASISASWAIAYCLSKLGISSSSVALINKFRVQEFDFSAGYVQIISDLLQSESYIGELDENEVLQIRTLTDETGTGPVIFTTDLQSVSPINAGGVPANAIGVTYKTWKFNSVPDPSQMTFSAGGGVQQDSGSQGITEEDTAVSPDEQPGWTYSETTGPVAFIAVPWKTVGGTEKTYETSYLPSTISKTSYGVIAGKKVPLQTTEVKSSIISAEAASYAAAQLKSGSFSELVLQGKTITTYEYHGNGEKKRQTTQKYESGIAVAGSTSLNFWYQDGTVDVGTGLVLTERVVVEYYQAGTAECHVTTKWQTWMHTQPGQQALAEARETRKTKASAESYLSKVLGGGIYMIGQNTDFSTRSDPNIAQDPALMKFPGNTDVANGRMGASSFGYQSDPPDASNAPVEESSAINWVLGGPADERRVVYSMPYSDDDQVVPLVAGGWTIIGGAAGTIANRYGRVQNRLTYGYRNGMEIQMNPTKMPGYAFAPIYISIDGLVAQYRVNNPSWVLTPGEAVASCNAIYWGVVGTS